MKGTFTEIYGDIPCTVHWETVDETFEAITFEVIPDYEAAASFDIEEEDILAWDLEDYKDSIFLDIALRHPEGFVDV